MPLAEYALMNLFSSLGTCFTSWQGKILDADSGNLCSSWKLSSPALRVIKKSEEQETHEEMTLD